MILTPLQCQSQHVGSRTASLWGTCAPAGVTGAALGLHQTNGTLNCCRAVHAASSAVVGHQGSQLRQPRRAIHYMHCQWFVSSLCPRYAAVRAPRPLPYSQTDVQRAVRAAEGFAPQVAAWIKQTPPSAVIEHGLFARRPEVLEAFAKEGWGKGRITLVGDAIHPARPTGTHSRLECGTAAASVSCKEAASPK